MCLFQYYSWRRLGDWVISGYCCFFYNSLLFSVHRAFLSSFRQSDNSVDQEKMIGAAACATLPRLFSCYRGYGLARSRDPERWPPPHLQEDSHAFSLTLSIIFIPVGSLAFGFISSKYNLLVGTQTLPLCHSQPLAFDSKSTFFPTWLPHSKTVHRKNIFQKVNSHVKYRQLKSISKVKQ